MAYICYDYDKKDIFGNRVITHAAHIGQIVSKYEHNGYDDSDFYYIWFDKETGKCGECKYDSTRYGEHPYDLTIDADEETIKAWCKWRENNVRKYKLPIVIDQYNRRHQVLSDMGIGMKEFHKLLKAYRVDSDEFDAIYTLLSTKKFNSEMRKSFNDQVRSWLADENPKYEKPLSYRQIECIISNFNKCCQLGPVTDSTASYCLRWWQC